jgi:DNA-directed RNA polymerase subunit RPC12/RpoP
MAFIHCPHCGREVSDLAHKCPGCGTSLDVYKENVIFCKYCGMEILPDEIHGETAFCVSCRRSQKIEITPLASLRSKSTEKRHIMIPADEIIIDKTEYKPLKPKSVIRISRCCMAVRNPSVFPK